MSMHTPGLESVVMQVFAAGKPSGKTVGKAAGMAI